LQYLILGLFPHALEGLFIRLFLAQCYPAHFIEPLSSFGDKLQFCPEGCWVVEDVDEGEDAIGYIIFYKWNIDEFGAPALSVPLKDQIPKNLDSNAELALNTIWLHDTALLPEYQGEGKICDSVFIIPRRIGAEPRPHYKTDIFSFYCGYLTQISGILNYLNEVLEEYARSIAVDQIYAASVQGSFPKWQRMGWRACPKLKKKDCYGPDAVNMEKTVPSPQTASA